MSYGRHPWDSVHLKVVIKILFNTIPFHFPLLTLFSALVLQMLLWRLLQILLLLTLVVGAPQRRRQQRPRGKQASQRGLEPKHSIAKLSLQLPLAE